MNMVRHDYVTMFAKSLSLVIPHRIPYNFGYFRFFKPAWASGILVKQFLIKTFIHEIEQTLRPLHYIFGGRFPLFLLDLNTLPEPDDFLKGGSGQRSIKAKGNENDCAIRLPVRKVSTIEGLQGKSSYRVLILDGSGDPSHGNVSF